MFADKTEVGWDPTIDSEYKDNERIFDIKICGKHYKTSTSNIVFQYDDIDMCSTATRIYKAFRADDIEEKEQLIIKDYWPTDFLETEDIRQKKMLDDIIDPLERQLVERSILTPISCERVKVGDREDHTKETILRGELPDRACRVVLPLELGETGSLLPLGSGSWVDLVEDPYSNTDPRLEGTDDKETYINRWHYRIAYKEVAIPYNDLRSLKDMALVIEHAIQGKSVSSMNDQMLMLNYLVALRIIHKAGWVHRDLSVGNLYLYIDPVNGEKRGLIGDFEFAKKVGGGGRYGTKTVIVFQIYPKL